MPHDQHDPLDPDHRCTSALTPDMHVLCAAAWHPSVLNPDLVPKSECHCRAHPGWWGGAGPPAHAKFTPEEATLFHSNSIASMRKQEWQPPLGSSFCYQACGWHFGYSRDTDKGAITGWCSPAKERAA